MQENQIASSPTNFTTLLTEDSNCFEDFAAFMPFFMIGPVQLTFAVFYLSYYINYTILGGLIFLIVLVVGLFILGKFIDYLKYYVFFFYANFERVFNLIFVKRTKKKGYTDQRLENTEEIFQKIKGIKLLGVENKYERSLNEIRK